jgi:tRNA (guanine-N7-)-methyltransferase
MSDEFLSQFSTVEQRRDRVGDLMAQILQKKQSLQGIQNPIPINLEIGCGHGHWLTDSAQLNQTSTFVGVDLITKRIEKAQAKAAKRFLENLFFLKVEANEFIEYLPSDFIIDQIYIMFPDPWPKNRHFKRRLIQDDFLQLLAKVSTQESLLFFRSDHLPYVEWTREKIKQSGNWEIVDQQLPFEHSSYFQDLLPSHQSIVAHVIHNPS